MNEAINIAMKWNENGSEITLKDWLIEQGYKEMWEENSQKQKACDIAKNLLDKNFSIKDISEITGLKESEISKIEKGK